MKEERRRKGITAAPWSVGPGTGEVGQSRQTEQGAPSSAPLQSQVETCSGQ